MKSNELFNKCLANVNPEVRQEVRKNMEKILKKTRVKEGENYWYINSDGEIKESWDEGEVIDDRRFDFRNYFNTQEEAESMARKLRSVLKGADVIEMPREEVLKEDYLEAKTVDAFYVRPSVEEYETPRR